jgi:hypothetical protein
LGKALNTAVLKMEAAAGAVARVLPSLGNMQRSLSEEAQIKEIWFHNPPHRSPLYPAIGIYL